MLLIWLIGAASLLIKEDEIKWKTMSLLVGMDCTQSVDCICLDFIQTKVLFSVVKIVDSQFNKRYAAFFVFS